MGLFSAINVKNNRLGGIDFLRGIAVLLVICRHWNICDFLGHAGWMGVDLFFVLSGFLISGLLFSENEKHEKINFLRFFIRRGFKIYPLFYMLIGLTVILYYFNGIAIPFKNLLPELLFFQNYYAGLYLHTWSLAIEEHFYILLIICFFILTRLKPLKHIATLYILLCLMSAVFLLRIFLCYINAGGIYFTTHTRIDSLLAGVVISYIWRYKKEWLNIFYTKARYILLVISIVCLSIFGFFEPNNLFTQSIGFSIIYLACSLLLVFVLTKESSPEKKSGMISRSLRFMGFYSYAIYLGHLPVLNILNHFGIEEGSGIKNIVYFFLYVLLCVITGVIFSELIEQPFLKLRNKYFVSKA